MPRISKLQRHVQMQLSLMATSRLHQDNTKQPIQLAFEVPRGFEDVAWRDIQATLSKAAAVTSTLDDCVAIIPGFVLLALPVGTLLNTCLSLHAEGSFWAVTRVLLSMQPADGDASMLPTLSSELCEGLQIDRKALPSKRSRAIVDPNASKARNNRTRRRVAPLNIDKTPFEQSFLERLSEIVQCQRHNHVEVYNIWKKIKHPGHHDDESLLPTTFAIRFERRDFLFPTMKSSRIAQHLAEEYGRQVLSLTGRKDLKADLLAPDYEVVTGLIQHNGTWLFLSGIALPSSSPPKHRLSRQHGRTTMLPERAYCLCMLHPELKSASREGKAMFFLDPCAGFGSIPLELAAIAKRDNLKFASIAADNELPSLEKASINIFSGNMDVQAGLTGLDQGVLWSGYGKGRSGGFREGTLDGIVTDLPWGIKELTPRAVTALYPALLRTLGHAARDGAYGVFLCQRERIFRAALLQNNCMWEEEEMHKVNVEGLQAFAFVVRRKKRSATILA